MKNRDTLIGTIAATIGGAISFLAQMGQFQLHLRRRGRRQRQPALGLLVAIILAPIAALVIQLAVSRGREYLARLDGRDAHRRPGGPRAGARDARRRRQQQRAPRRGCAAASPAGGSRRRRATRRSATCGSSTRCQRRRRRRGCSRPTRRSTSGSPASGRCASAGRPDHRLPHHMRRGPQARRVPPSSLIDPPPVHPVEGRPRVRPVNCRSPRGGPGAAWWRRRRRAGARSVRRSGGRRSGDADPVGRATGSSERSRESTPIPFAIDGEGARTIMPIVMMRSSMWERSFLGVEAPWLI